MKKLTSFILLTLMVVLGVHAQYFNGYYSIKNGNGQYINVLGRKTVGFTSTPESAPGTVIKLVTETTTDKRIVVKELRSQGVDLPGYAKRAMNYVPDIIDAVAKKLGYDQEGSLLGGEDGIGAIYDKFESSFDYNLYLEPAGNGYRIYGKTPSMEPVKEFYNDPANHDKIVAKLPMLEGEINRILQKVLNKAGYTDPSYYERYQYSILKAWERMGGENSGLTKPDTDENILKFYDEVLNNEQNIWNFAYESVMIYWDKLIEKVEEKLNDSSLDLGEFKKYLDYVRKLPQVRPDTKYYIVADTEGRNVDFISDGNADILNNVDRTIWTIKDRADFTLTFEKELTKNEGSEYWRTFYADFEYTLPEDVTAYKVTGIDNDGLAILETLEGTIPAQSAVLLMTNKSNSDNDKVVRTLTFPTAQTSASYADLSGNLLYGNDYLVNNEPIYTSMVVSIFNSASELLGESFYNEYIKQYEHLQYRNAGTVNNKYFFGLSLDDLSSATQETIRVLGTGGENGDGLGFYCDFAQLKANEAFLIVDNGENAQQLKYNPVKLFCVPDINRDGTVNTVDLSAMIDILLGKDNNIPYKFDHDAADVDRDGDIGTTDLSELIDILLKQTSN